MTISRPFSWEILQPPARQLLDLDLVLPPDCLTLWYRTAVQCSTVQQPVRVRPTANQASACSCSCSSAATSDDRFFCYEIQDRRSGHTTAHRTTAASVCCVVCLSFDVAALLACSRWPSLVLIALMCSQGARPCPHRPHIASKPSDINGLDPACPCLSCVDVVDSSQMKQQLPSRSFLFLCGRSEKTFLLPDSVPASFLSVLRPSLTAKRGGGMQPPFEVPLRLLPW
ncbi:hypothetical protein BCV70DRAFT_82177 [Testicularia cyperi]|uniref:Uncharacterized protein n=1 Tax=Testicularia cyperi TaxID=1882483 RepID=A0A317XF63_9BASI|nr:hypothetical protein BCV70DRAFT_82177 [Testicularia cyperi]